MSDIYLEFCTRDPVDPDGKGEKEVHYDFTRKLPYPRDWDEREGQGRMRQWPRRECIEGLVRKAIIDFDWDEEIGGPMPAEFGDAELNIVGDLVDAPGSPYMKNDGSVRYEFLTDSWMIDVEVT